jgi:hypothetical protein
MQSVTIRAFAAVVLALLAVTSMANAQQEGVYTIPHYKFETGQEMDNVKIGYVTYGNLNADKSNAVLLVPGTSSGRHWADEYVGPGKMYDPKADPPWDPPRIIKVPSQEAMSRELNQPERREAMKRERLRALRAKRAAKAPRPASAPLGNGHYCYPLTVSDHASRFLLLCEALESTRATSNWKAAVRL